MKFRISAWISGIIGFLTAALMIIAGNAADDGSYDNAVRINGPSDFLDLGVGFVTGLFSAAATGLVVTVVAFFGVFIFLIIAEFM